MRLAFLLTASLLLSPAPAGAGEELAVVAAGKPQDPIEAYKAGSKLYLDAKRVGDLYGGQVYWYPVSGRVRLSVRGRSLDFVAGSDKASNGSEELDMGEALLVRASRAFIPVPFLTSEGFQRWSGHETRFDERTKTIVVERKGTVGAPRAFSYKDRTRLSLELAPGASWRSAARGTGAAEIVVDFGAAEGDESVQLEDGIVDSYSLKQEARLVRLTVKFAETGLKWKAFEAENPRRVVLEAYGRGAGDAAKAAVAAPVETPETKPAASEPKKPELGPGGRVEGGVGVNGRDKKKKRLVVIDPGHGGKDPGATGRRGTREKDVNLAAALELAKVLRERGDFEVLLTREEDVFVPLSERSELANRKEADLFVSLHCNAAASKRENGFEVYSVSETASDPAAEALAAKENAVLELEGKNVEDESAKLILLAMTKTEMINESAEFAALAAKKIEKRVDVEPRGAKQAAFYVLRGTHAPAILVEMAFVSHPKDEAKLASRRFRRTMAEGVAAGIADYARREGWLD